MGKLFEELKRRKVIRVSAVYAVVAWLLIQVAATVLPALQLPGWTISFVTILFILGFPVAIILAWAYEVTPEGVKEDALVQAAPPSASTAAQPINYLILAIVLLVAGFQVADRFLLATGSTGAALSGSLGDSSNVRPVRRYNINLGATIPRGGSGMNADVALSPDGSKLVFALQRPGSPQQVFLMQLDRLQAESLEGAEGGDYPYFSPDGRGISINISGSLNRVSIEGGPAQLLVQQIANGSSSFWTPEDSIFYWNADDTISRVAATGGPTDSIDVENSDFGLGHRFPVLLPDGDRLLLSQFDRANSARNSQIILVTLSSGESRQLIQNGFNARYVPTGHIVFVRSADLWAVPFDLDRLELIGPEVPVIRGVQSNGATGSASYTFSNDGLLIYLPGIDAAGDASQRILTWVDREGNEELLDERRDFRVPVDSPDGQRLALVVNNGDQNDIWTYDLARNTLSRLTFSESNDYFPQWTPDGRHIVFTSDREPGGLWRRAADGTGQAELLLGTPVSPGYEFDPERAPVAHSFTPDGTRLVYSMNGDLHLLEMSPNSNPEPLLQSDFIHYRADISPDGRWIAYESDETGQNEIYVRPFPDIQGGKWQISSSGGEWPKWNSNGRELTYRGLSAALNTVWSVQVEAGSPFQFQIPALVATGNYRGTGSAGAFDISADGSRFLLLRNSDNTSAAMQTQLVAVENWFEELRRLAPADLQ